MTPSRGVSLTVAHGRGVARLINAAAVQPGYEVQDELGQGDKGCLGAKASGKAVWGKLGQHVPAYSRRLYLHCSGEPLRLHVLRAVMACPRRRAPGGPVVKERFKFLSSAGSEISPQRLV